MLNQFLVPKQVVEANGSSEPLVLGAATGTALQLTLEVLAAVEQESLEVRIEGTVDGATWEEKPLAAYSQKFQKGAWVIICDLAARPDVTAIRASWKLNRWGRGSLKPHFELYLFAESAASLALDSK